MPLTVIIKFSIFVYDPSMITLLARRIYDQIYDDIYTFTDVCYLIELIVSAT